jgi:hypothetical protein
MVNDGLQIVKHGLRTADGEFRRGGGGDIGPLKPALDRLYAEFNYPDSAADPIQIVRRFPRRDDREVVGFIAASLAFGRVASVLQSIERVLAIAGGEPAEYVRHFEPRRDGRAFKDVVHRWTRGPDLVALLWVTRQILDRSGSSRSISERRTAACPSGPESAIFFRAPPPAAAASG